MSNEQPEPVDVDIPAIGRKIMFSGMDEVSLTRLRDFIDRLIKWKAAEDKQHGEKT